MYTEVEEYDNGAMITVLFFEKKDDDYAFARVGFDKIDQKSGFRGPWQASVAWTDNSRWAIFDFAPGEPLAEAASDRVKRTLGILGWAVLEEAVRLVFPSKYPRRNPRRRRSRR